MSWELKKEREGRMGNDLSVVWVVLVNGVEVGWHKRKWMATGIAQAIDSGAILPDGDTTARYSNWARDMAPDVYARIVATGADHMD